VRLARGGGILIACALGFFAAVFLVWWTALMPLPAWLLPAAILCLLSFLLFFRDPERVPPPDLSPGIAVSPADGIVVQTGDEGGGPALAVYLRLSDVHVTRMPLPGEVKQIDFIPGGHRRAASPGSRTNARLVAEFETPWGGMTISQVTGLLARRIVTYLANGGTYRRGERIGLIRFGSRVEVVFPDGYRIIVGPGARVRAGVTPVARPDDGTAAEKVE